jgi:predicted O-methyltransferase YrrM
MTKGMTPVGDRLYDYLLNVSLREPDVLRKLREETDRLGGISRMQIAPDQGQLMAMLVAMTGARTYLEVGTFTGYSTLACAMALPADGRVVACDISEEWTAIGKPYWAEAGVADKIDLRLGPAAETLQTLLTQGHGDGFDLMFIDADKTGYETYYELGLQLVRRGGVILVDNVLWSGAVADPTAQDEDTVALRHFNQKLHTDSRIQLSMLAVGDGLTLARRVS